MEWIEPNFCSLAGLPLPPMTVLQIGWQEDEHNEVLTLKNKIKEFGSQEEWELRKKVVNLFEAIYSCDDSFPSITSITPLSRSYFKMVEMLDLADFWNQSFSFTTAHACEGPGGFIQHIVEKAKEKHKQIQGVYAITLKPTKTHIPGWRRSFYFLRKHPEVHLEYGFDGRGNILDIKNQNHFIKNIRDKKCVCLFTADGGFDFSVDYNKQEQSVFPLLLASFLIGLQTLQIGGYCIIKIFDLYSDATKDLLIGTSTFFESFTIYKPATSRPCNSERYFIGRGYLGKESAQRWILHLQETQKKIKINKVPLTRLFLTQWPKKIKELFQEQIQWQETLQMKSIYDTLNLDKANILKYVEKNIQTSRAWCKRYDIPIFTYYQNQDEV